MSNKASSSFGCGLLVLLLFPQYFAVQPCADSNPDRDLRPEAEAERLCVTIGHHARGLTSFVAPARSECSLWGKTWFVWRRYV